MVSLTLDLKERAQTIGLLCTDCDGVLTDGGVYYGPEGEIMKRFSSPQEIHTRRWRTLACATGLISVGN